VLVKRWGREGESFPRSNGNELDLGKKRRKIE
jgi:hypothetical protein